MAQGAHLVMGLVLMTCLALGMYAWALPKFRGQLGQPRWTAYRSLPGLWCASFVVILTVGAYGAQSLIDKSIDAHLHDTYYVVAHVHYLGSFLLVSLALAASILVFEQIVHAAYSRWIAVAQWASWQAGILMMLYSDMASMNRGMPGRFTDAFEVYDPANRLSSIGAWLCLGSVVLMGVLVIEARIAKRPRRHCRHETE